MFETIRRLLTKKVKNKTPEEIKADLIKNWSKVCFYCYHADVHHMRYMQVDRMEIKYGGCKCTRCRMFKPPSILDMVDIIEIRFKELGLPSLAESDEERTKEEV